MHDEMLNLDLDRVGQALAEDVAWRALIDASYDLLMLVGEDGLITMASGASSSLLGLAPSELVGTNGLALVHPDDAESVIIGLEHNRLGMHTDRVLARFRHSDGSWVPLELVAANEFDNPALGGLVVSARDLVGRTRVRHDADHERVMLATVLHNMVEGIVATDEDGRISLMNRAARELLTGSNVSQMPMRWPSEAVLVDLSGTELPPDRHPLAMILAGHIVKGEELIVVRPDGSQRQVVIRGQPLGGDPGTAAGAVLGIDDVTDQRAGEQELAFRALHDPLTGLANRALFSDRLDVALARRSRDGRSVAVLFCDLDQFKVVNDSLGHRAGDELLLQVADRLTSAVRESDTLARLGGDEFVLVCDIDDPSDAIAIAENLADALRPPMRLGHLVLSVTASIGIAISDDGHEDAVALIRDADAAMYLAKERGRARYEMFDDALRARAVRRLEVDELLRANIEDDLLVTHFQPIVSVSDGRVVAVEALSRCRLADGTLVLPIDFLAVAEQNGAIARIDHTAMARSCAAARLLLDTFGSNAPTVACNVSTRQLSRPDFVELVLAELNRFNVPPKQLCLEITETSIISVTDSSHSSLHRLRSLGVHLAVDDLGAGYSSLQLLRDLPFSLVKIDKTFINGLPGASSDSTIVKAIVELVHALGLTVLAEGVERDEQRDAIEALGCDWYQGNLHARPMDLDALMDHLRRRS